MRRVTKNFVVITEPINIRWFQEVAYRSRIGTHPHPKIRTLCRAIFAANNNKRMDMIDDSEEL